MILYRQAEISDLKAICDFTDFWLAGRGKRVDAPGAVDDYFISPSQHRKYIKKYRVLLAVDDLQIIGWAVLEPSGTLINILVSGRWRKQGIGRKMIQILNPDTVRSKNNQSSGDPKKFYEKVGFHLVRSERSRSRLDIDRVRPVRAVNIDIFSR